MTYTFGPFHLDARSRRLTRGDDVVPISDRHFEVLLRLLAHAGQVVSKDTLIRAAWSDVAVTDNSLEQIISSLRRTLGPAPPPATAYVETLARRGYRFAVPTTSSASRQSDETLAALLAPYRAMVDGRAALETLDREAVARACRTFEEITRLSPDFAQGHLGLANALALTLESVRAEHGRDEAALDRALHHASEACRLDPVSGEAWATLSLLCHQSRDSARAVASAQRAAALEPDNWRHHLRVAYVSWGEARLRAAHRVLKLLPDFPFAHWLAATVHVARQALDSAASELTAGAAAQDRQPDDAPFKGVGLHWLRGLVRLASGDEAGAIEEWHRELALEPSRHIYGREACANTWCAIGGVHLRHGRIADAGAAFVHAMEATPGHVTALAALSALGGPKAERSRLEARLAELRAQGAGTDAALADAVYETGLGNPEKAADIVLAALEEAEPGSGGWHIPIDPLLNVDLHRGAWAPVLTLLRSRAL
jgi:DNA-binding winged helix-turn-helix (wHTH) protein